MPAWGVQIREDTFTPKLRGLTARMKQNVVERVDAVGQGMVDLARSIAPERTGALKRSICFRVNPDMAFEFGNDVDYGLWVEIGTRRMMARPHIRPALDAFQQKLLDAILVGCMKAFQ